MEFIQQNLILIAAAVISGAMLLFTSLRRPGGANAVSPTQATQLINREDAQIIDVREPSEFSDTLGHIPGAHLLPLSQLTARLSEVDRNCPIVTVCRSGARSAQASVLLGRSGFDKVANLAGGMLRWRAQSMPVEQGSD